MLIDNVAERLIWLGFTPMIDFVCRDDGDGPYLAEWLSDLPQPTEAEIAAASIPGPSALEAKSQLLAMIDAATRPILDAYPPAERLSWDAKEQEAKAVLAADEPTAATAPLLAGEIAAQFGIVPSQIEPSDLTDKATVVIAKATAWRALVSAVSGLRQRFDAEIDAAEDDDARKAVINAAQAAVAALVS